jgi:type IV secretion system protein VirB6
MTDACSAVGQGAGFISSITDYVDCQAQTLGSGAWTALSMPGSTLQLVLTGFLTIFIALIGYNLLLGTALTVRSGTIAFVKIGAVFALATSWPAYRTVVYDLVTDGPGQLVGEIGPRAGVVGSDGTLVQRLDLADHAFAQLAILGPGTAPADAYQQIAPPPFAGFDAFALGGARIVFLLTAAGGLVIVRIITGLMLALGPFFIAFLLFDTTRSFFEGWMRVLAGAALGAIGVSIGLGLELAFLDPWLSSALARRMAGEALPTLPTELFVITCLFTAILVAALYACARIARGFALPLIARVEASVESTSRTATSRVGSERSEEGRAAGHERSRAVALASLIHSSSLRERADLERLTASNGPTTRTIEIHDSNSAGGRQAVPLGRSFSRRPGARVSALAAKRDSAA